MTNPDQLILDTPPQQPARAEPAPPTKPPRAKPAAAAPSGGWRQPMPLAPRDPGKHPAPYDGSFVNLLGDPRQGEWYWYQTRQFRKGCWQHIAWWRMRFGENSPPKFTPSGWRPASEGLPT